MDKRALKELLVRLMYVEMLGHDASWGHVTALQACSDKTLLTKKVWLHLRRHPSGQVPSNRCVRRSRKSCQGQCRVRVAKPMCRQTRDSLLIHRLNRASSRGSAIQSLGEAASGLMYHRVLSGCVLGLGPVPGPQQRAHRAGRQHAAARPCGRQHSRRCEQQAVLTTCILRGVEHLTA